MIAFPIINVNGLSTPRWLGAVTLKNQAKVISESVTLPVLLQPSMIDQLCKRRNLMFQLRCTLRHTVPSRMIACLYTIEFPWPLVAGNGIISYISMLLEAIWEEEREPEWFLEYSSVFVFFSKSDLWVPINSLIGTLSIWLPLSL